MREALCSAVLQREAGRGGNGASPILKNPSGGLISRPADSGSSRRKASRRKIRMTERVRTILGMRI